MTRNSLTAFARRVHVAKPLKEVYFRLAAPADRLCRTRLTGAAAKFFAPTAGEWMKASQFNSGEAEIFLDVPPVRGLSWTGFL